MNWWDFNVEDTSGGPVAISDYTTSVFKFDASTFYNWQIDNLPLTDLQQRDDFMYLMLGAPASAVEGVTFTLSGTAGGAGTNIFTDIDDITARIPKRLTFPMLIELCAYGDLGKLELNGIKTEGRGSLKIVNKLKVENPQAHFGSTAAHLKVGKFAEEAQLYQVSGMWDNRAGTSWDNLVNASSTHVGQGAGIYSAANWRTNVKGFAMKAPHINEGLATDFVTLISHDSGDGSLKTILDTPGNVLQIDKVYDNTEDGSISGYDPAPKSCNGWGTNLFSTSGDTTAGASLRGSLLADVGTSDSGTTCLYGNSFSSVELFGSQGDILLEGILADGVSGTFGASSFHHAVANGFDIRDSSVTLKDCMAMRCSQTGFNIINSNVDTLDYFAAARIYNISAINPTAVDFNARIGRGHDIYSDGGILQKHGDTSGSNGIGVNCHMSTLNLLHTSATNFNQNKVRFAFGCDTGWKFNQSTLGGGFFNGALATTATRKTTYLQSIYNKRNGIELFNSTVNFRGVIESFKNEDNGLYASNSKLEFAGCAFEDNQNVGLHLDGSKATYNSALKNAGLGLGSRVRRGQTSLTNNGQNLRAVGGSEFAPKYPTQVTEGRDEYFDDMCGYFTASAFHHGTLSDKTSLNKSALDGGDTHFQYMSDASGCIPGYYIGNGSRAELVGLNYKCTALARGTVNASNANKAARAIFGQAVLADAGSEVILRGFDVDGKVTCIGTELHAGESAIKTDIAAATVGGNNEVTQAANGTWHKAGVCAKNNSTIRVMGATKMYRWGVDLLAENHSSIIFSNQQRPWTDGNQIDAQGYFDMSGSDNATKVELHSTRACVVANNFSTIDMRHIGSSAIGGQDAATSYDYGYHNQSMLGWSSYANGAASNPAAAIKDGYIKFYPNPYTNSYITDRHLLLNATNPGTGAGLWNDTGSTVVITASGAAGNKDSDAPSLGGICVKAANNSKVNVFDVNFNAFVSGGDVSGPYLEVGTGAGQCERPHIWNITQDSKITARNMSLNHTAASANNTYHGPSGTWHLESPKRPDANQVQDRLDDFGPNGYFASAAADAAETADLMSKNWGYFRLYFGVDDVVHSLCPSGAEADGGANGNHYPQLLAQGYAPSSNLPQIVIGSLDMWASSTGTTTNLLTGANFPLDILDVSSYTGKGTGRTKNILDESSANMFANAKHASNPNIGLCSIIKPGAFAGSDEQDHLRDGKGFKSTNRFNLEETN